MTQQGTTVCYVLANYCASLLQAISRRPPQLIRGVREGKLKHRETIVEGLENAPAALNQLFDGSNIGKLMVKVVE